MRAAACLAPLLAVSVAAQTLVETFRDGIDEGWCTYATCDTSSPAIIRWGHGSGHLTRACFNQSSYKMPSSHIVITLRSEVDCDGYPCGPYTVVVEVFRGSERVYNAAVYVNSTTTTLDIPLATLDSSHTVKIMTNGYQATVDEGLPVIFYSIIFLGAGVAQATAGDPCSPIGAIVTSCERSTSWGSQHLCLPASPPPTSPPPPPCGVDDCTCACCSNGRCLDSDEASFWAGDRLSCSTTECARRFYECPGKAELDASPALAAVSGPSGLSNSAVYHAAVEPCMKPPPPPPCGAPDCSCACCFAADCPTLTTKSFRAGSVAACSASACMSRYSSCPDKGLHNAGSQARRPLHPVRWRL